MLPSNERQAPKLEILPFPEITPFSQYVEQLEDISARFSILYMGACSNTYIRAISSGLLSSIYATNIMNSSHKINNKKGGTNFFLG